MSNELDMKKQATDVEPGGDNPEHVRNRRRILRAGVKVVPVVLGTLSARTSLACHCTIPSAWGSIATGLGGAQDVTEVSLKGSLVRFGSSDTTNKADNIRYFDNPYRSISGWRHNSAFTSADTSSAWSRWYSLVGKVSSYPNTCDTPVKKVNYLRGFWRPNASTPYLNGVGLLNKLGITGVTSSNFSNSTAQSIVNSSSSDSSILVALLCLKLNADFGYCLSQSDLVKMANRTFPIPRGFTSFGDTEIKEYLHYNWMARLDNS